MRINISINVDDNIVRFIKKIFNKKNISGIFVLFLLAATIVYASTIEKPYTFNKGDTIIASEMNKNFDEVYKEINEISRGDLIALHEKILKIEESIRTQVIKIENKIDLIEVKDQLNTKIIAMWSGDFTEVPSGWSISNDNTNLIGDGDIGGKFIVGAGGEYNPGESEIVKHNHDIDHVHDSEYTEKVEHSHIWSRLKRREDYHILDGSWAWETYNANGWFDLVKWNKGQYPVSTIGNYIPLARSIDNISDDDPYYENYWTSKEIDNEKGHYHEIDLGPMSESDKKSSDAECVPPYYSLLFIIKDYEGSGD